MSDCCWKNCIKKVFFYLKKNRDPYVTAFPFWSQIIHSNKQVALPSERYFRCGDVDGLKNRILALLDRKTTKEEWKDMRGLIEKEYNWDRIAEQTIEVYRKAVRKE